MVWNDLEHRPYDYLFHLVLPWQRLNVPGLYSDPGNRFLELFKNTNCVWRIQLWYYGVSQIHIFLAIFVLTPHCGIKLCYWLWNCYGLCQKRWLFAWKLWTTWWYVVWSMNVDIRTVRYDLKGNIDCSNIDYTMMMMDVWDYCFGP